MKKVFILMIVIACLLAGCVLPAVPTTPPTTSKPTEAPTQPTTPTSVPTQPTEPTEPPTEPSTAPPAPTEPPHSALYMPGVSVEDVIRYFNEVCLNAEFVIEGDPTKLQRWEGTIRFICVGTRTEKDNEVLNSFVDWLNTIEGFPGIEETQDEALANLRICFYNYTDYIGLMGDNFYGTDGGVTFWYNGANEIYHGVIAYRTDIDQYTRNSVILEEIYNGLGPINDTDLRLDSVIYSGYSTPQWLSEMDQLILKLLYHPQMRCGMTAAECEEVIRQLYY